MSNNKKGSNQFKLVRKSDWKRKVRKIIMWVLWLSVALAIMFGYVRTHYQNITLVDREVIVDNLSGKIEEVRGGIIADIKLGESQGKPENAGLIVYDTNHQMSIGSYQYQILTVQHYYKKLYNKDITRKEAILIALDDSKAGQLTYDIVFKEKGGWKNWYNSGMKYKIGDRIALLDSLTK